MAKIKKDEDSMYQECFHKLEWTLENYSLLQTGLCNLSKKLQRMRKSEFPHIIYPPDLIKIRLTALKKYEKISVKKKQEADKKYNAAVTNYFGDSGTGYHYGYNTSDEIKFWNERKKQLQSTVSAIESGLNLLTKEEREVIDVFYITPPDSTLAQADILTERIALERSSIYRMKRTAMRKLMLAVYGLD